MDLVLCMCLMTAYQLPCSIQVWFPHQSYQNNPCMRQAALLARLGRIHLNFCHSEANGMSSCVSDSNVQVWLLGTREPHQTVSSVFVLFLQEF
jgi:hypothetical protein